MLINVLKMYQISPEAITMFELVRFSNSGSICKTKKALDGLYVVTAYKQADLLSLFSLFQVR